MVGPLQLVSGAPNSRKGRPFVYPALMTRRVRTRAAVVTLIQAKPLLVQPPTQSPSRPPPGPAARDRLSARGGKEAKGDNGGPPALHQQPLVVLLGGISMSVGGSLCQGGSL